MIKRVIFVATDREMKEVIFTVNIHFHCFRLKSGDPAIESKFGLRIVAQPNSHVMQIHNFTSQRRSTMIYSVV
jgi:hypothetical protein